jgi:hypothetical protein
VPIFRNPLVECFWPSLNILSTSPNDILKLNIQIIDKPINAHYFARTIVEVIELHNVLDVLQKLEEVPRCSNEIHDIGLLIRLHVNLCHFYLYNSMATSFLSYHNTFIGTQVKCTFGHGSQV